MTATNQPTNQLGAAVHRRGPLTVAVLGKGGSGKTTSTAAIADAAQRRTGAAVQLLDLDAQASLTTWLAPDLADDDPTVDDVLVGDAHLAGVTRRLREGLTLAPAANGLAAIEPLLPVDALAHRVLLSSTADVVLIDTPATRPLGPGAVILRSVLSAADVVVVPYRSSVLDLDALDETLSQIDAHEQIAGRTLPTLLLPTMTTRDGSADLVVRALRVGGGRGFEVLPPVPLSAWAVKAVGARSLLADRAPARAAIVSAYADVADAVLAAGTRAGVC